MIILFKNNKIIGVDNNLLNLLNIDFNNLSNIISELELLISSKKEHTITLQNYSFEVQETPIISLEDIKVFDLKKKSEFNIEQPLLETELSILPREEPSLKIEEPKLEISKLEGETKIEEIPQINLEKSLTQPEIQISHTEEEIKPINLEEEIKISFESNLEEINKILSLDKKQANELIKEDLKKASEDLSIDFQMINELYKDLLNQIKNEKKSLYEAIEKQDYEKIHKIAHTLKGAALNLRLSNLALILKNIDEESKTKKPIEEIKFLVDKFYDFVNKLENKKDIPENIKNLILITIKDYLASQNEKKFKKDLKYIEKLLNTKINSLEDLQELVKE